MLQFFAFGTAVSEPGSRALGSSHFGGPSSLVAGLVRDAFVPDGSSAGRLRAHALASGERQHGHDQYSPAAPPHDRTLAARRIASAGTTGTTIRASE